MSIHFSRKSLYSPKILLRRTLPVGDVGLLPGDKSEFLPPNLGTYPVAPGPAPGKKQLLVLSCCHPGEALYLKFEAQGRSREWAPTLFMVRAGRVNAISGLPWDADQEPNFSAQNYLVASPQSWLDGFKDTRNMVRQFVVTASSDENAESSQLEIKAYFLTPQALEAITSKGQIPPFVRCDQFRLKGCSGKAMMTPGGLLKQKVYLDPFGESSWSPRCVGSVRVLFLSPEHFERRTQKAALSPLRKAYLEKANYPDGNPAFWKRAFDESVQSIEAEKEGSGDALEPRGSSTSPYGWWDAFRFWG